MKRRQRVQRGGLARTGTARDDDVQPAGDGGLKIDRHLFGEGAELDQVVDRQLFLLELPDRDQRAVDRDRRHHGVEARAVGQAGVDIGVRFIDPPAHRRHDLVDDPQQVAFVLEGDVGQLQLAGAFDEDLMRAVDQDIVDRVVLQQRLQRAEAGDLVVELLVQRLPFLAVQHHGHLFQRLAGDRGDLGPQVGFGGLVQRREVQVVQKPLVQLDLDLAQPLLALALLVGAATCGSGLRRLARRRPARARRLGGGGRGGARRVRRQSAGACAGRPSGRRVSCNARTLALLLHSRGLFGHATGSRREPTWRVSGFPCAAGSWPRFRPAAGRGRWPGSPACRRRAAAPRCRCRGFRPSA